MAMTANEERMLGEYLATSISYLEFGAGESTLLAVRTPSIERIRTIESSPGFVEEYFHNCDDIAQSIESGRLKFQFVDIGQIRDWGIPADYTKKHLWPNYSVGAFMQEREVDLVLIDGRFRVACALSSILNCDNESRLLIHDFTEYPQLFFLLKFLRIEKRVDSLVALRPKQDLKRSRIQKAIRKYQYLPQDKNLLIKIKGKIIQALGVKPYKRKRM